MFYSIGYNLFAGLQPDPFWGVSQWVWTHSGNKDKSAEPLDSGSAQDVVAADVQVAHLSQGYGSLASPALSNHAPGFRHASGVEFINSNAAFGDGHVENRQTLDYWVDRIHGGGVDGTFAY